MEQALLDITPLPLDLIRFIILPMMAKSNYDDVLEEFQKQVDDCKKYKDIASTSRGVRWRDYN